MLNVFSIGNGKDYELTRENFIQKTHKQFPFYQDAKKYENPYFAICPACNNPIQIINLFGAQYREETTGKTNMHGRHFLRDIKGLPKYNQLNYDGCPLHKPTAFKIAKIRENKLVNEEIKKLIEDNRRKLASDIRDITGILLKNERIYQMIDDYIVAKDYCYTHTNKYNIPYSILYTRKAIKLFGQRIGSTELGEKIHLAIKENSENFDVKERRIIKKVDEFVLPYLLVSNHRINGSKQYMTICIEENSEHNDTRCIFREEIEMKQYIYLLKKDTE
ncbi:hypothetical protein [Anaerosinus gibii]|uniref:Uncharacterized protein n=1 Tax=Selenobaculum gibii TaxID=3054208 RepID=A0A9Y2AJS0_9FIRM|nr:hypothetical protein [Selenobaculum gbiensis]WIW71474.1 hypothetical protein P3F81_03980 [Selenobaculum gbiensis]